MHAWLDPRAIARRCVWEEGKSCLQGQVAACNVNAEECQRTGTTSSIFRIIRTHSEAKEMALVDTSKGWTTFSS